MQRQDIVPGKDINQIIPAKKFELSPSIVGGDWRQREETAVAAWCVCAGLLGGITSAGSAKRMIWKSSNGSTSPGKRASGSSGSLCTNTGISSECRVKFPSQVESQLFICVSVYRDYRSESVPPGAHGGAPNPEAPGSARENAAQREGNGGNLERITLSLQGWLGVQCWIIREANSPQ